MDKTSKLFDAWAKTGRSEEMGKGHGTTVNQFLDKLFLKGNFRFLDIGCGNGWVVRKMSEKSSCIKAIGIDKSKMMIKNAKSKISSKKENYFVTELESWNTKEKFDIIFSMESLYYADSIELALKKIFKLLKPGGQFFCGTDFYTDNKATAKWAKIMKIQMHLHSKKEWKEFFQNSGFKVKTKQVKDLKNSKKWKREWGTLFIIGTKPEK